MAKAVSGGTIAASTGSIAWRNVADLRLRSLSRAGRPIMSPPLLTVALATVKNATSVLA